MQSSAIASRSAVVMPGRDRLEHGWIAAAMMRPATAHLLDLFGRFADDHVEVTPQYRLARPSYGRTPGPARLRVDHQQQAPVARRTAPAARSVLVDGEPAADGELVVVGAAFQRAALDVATVTDRGLELQVVGAFARSGRSTRWDRRSTAMSSEIVNFNTAVSGWSAPGERVLERLRPAAPCAGTRRG